MIPINRQQLLENRGDLSQFLIHLTRSGYLKRFKDLYSLEKEDVVPVDAERSLRSIISHRELRVIMEDLAIEGWCSFTIVFQICRRDRRSPRTDTADRSIDLKRRHGCGGASGGGWGGSTIGSAAAGIAILAGFQLNRPWISQMASIAASPKTATCTPWRIRS